MNKSAIKGFSVRARRKLIEDISQKAYALGIKGTGKYDDIEEFEGGFRVKNAVNQIIYPLSTKKDREKLIAEINRKGFEQVVEEVAYTWFNRIIAIRFMEINEYLPVKVRMLSSEVKGKTEPDVITHIYDYVSELELDGEKVFNLKENHKDEELFKYVFVKECNNLGNLMPQVFEAIGDYTELLLPDQLLSNGSIIRDLVESIDEEDFREEVEIIGWMYQYYISEKKDEVFAALKNNKKITKENIPAATQLFTPKWIVKYMTENSLGRLWQESHPDESLKQKWEYYIEPAEQEPEVQKKLDELKNPNLSPEEIKILDPAMGSGHILVYAFDVLYDIYLSRGYAERDIPQLILEKNLYGLDIDDRAVQLASFALLMKARSKNRRFFRNGVILNICSIKDSNGLSRAAFDYLVNQSETQIDKVLHYDDIEYLVSTFKNAKEYGSILKVKKVDYEPLKKRVKEIENFINSDIFEYSYRNELLDFVPELVKCAEILSNKYHVVIANPPYMGRRKSMNGTLAEYIDKEYPDSKMDLFSVFIERGLNLLEKNSYIGYMTPYVWLYINSYAILREKLIQNSFSVDSLIQLEESSFKDAAVPICSFVLNNIELDMNGVYVKLSEFPGEEVQESKYRDALTNNVNYKFIYKTSSFSRFPDSRFVYWLNEESVSLFESEESLGNILDIKQGITTSDNNRFLRYWHEIEYQKMGIGLNQNNHKESGFKWFPYNKGGKHRKWYGNNELVINYMNDGEELKAFHDILNKTNPGGRLKNREYYFKRGITWSDISGRNFAARAFSNGFLFDVKGSSAFPTDEYYYYYLLSLMNSCIMPWFVDILNPTSTTQVGDIKQIPIVIKNEYLNLFNQLAEKCVKISKNNWDRNETSWDFSKNPMLEHMTDNSIMKSYLEMENCELSEIGELNLNYS